MRMTGGGKASSPVQSMLRASYSNVSGLGTGIYITGNWTNVPGTLPKDGTHSIGMVS